MKCTDNVIIASTLFHGNEHLVPGHIPNTWDPVFNADIDPYIPPTQLVSFLLSLGSASESVEVLQISLQPFVLGINYPINILSIRRISRSLLWAPNILMVSSLKRWTCHGTLHHEDVHNLFSLSKVRKRNFTLTTSPFLRHDHRHPTSTVHMYRLDSPLLHINGHIYHLELSNPCV